MHPPLGRILSQISDDTAAVPVQILAQAKGKEASNDALPKFVERYTLTKCVGTLTKESHSGKLVGDWEKVIADSEVRPEVVDMSTAVSAFMGVKDSEELVSKVVA